MRLSVIEWSECMAKGIIFEETRISISNPTETAKT
jgi:hypothetical protein